MQATARMSRLVAAVAAALLAVSVAAPVSAQSAAPARPTGLAAWWIAHNAVALSWDDPGDASITSYKVLRRDRDSDAPGVFSEIDGDTASAAAWYVDWTVEPSKRYVYRVVAVNAYGDSPRSSYVDVNTPAGASPAAPTGLSASSVAHYAVTLEWDRTADTSITSYKVLRRDRDSDAPGVFSEIDGDTASAETSYTDATVEASKRYVYRVVAVNAYGDSPRSSYVDVNTPAGAPPAAPTGLSASSVAHYAVTLEWDRTADTSITSYKVLRRDRDSDAPGVFSEIDGDTASAETSYTDATVEASKRYVYRVVAVNAYGDSPRSSYVDVNTPAAPDTAGQEESDEPQFVQQQAPEDGVVIGEDQVVVVSNDDETVTIADENLRAVIETALGKSPGEDITPSDMESLTTLTAYNAGITNLAGIEYATNLTHLSVSSNELTSIDVSALTNLTDLSASHNELTSLDVSALTNLTYLSASHNELTSLDVSALTNLEYVTLGSNKLTSLDVSALTNLVRLSLGSNELTSIDVSALTNLNHLFLAHNRLTAIDVSNNTSLSDLTVSGNRFTTLDVSALTNLKYLSVGFNRFGSLDLSTNTKLISLNAVYIGLTAIDLSNNTELTSLDLQDNELTSVDLTGLTKLERLDLQDNELTSIDLSPGDLNRPLHRLTRVELAFNDITSLDLSNYYFDDNGVKSFSDITHLDVRDNRLTSLNVSMLGRLATFLWSDNPMSFGDITF